MYLEKRLVRGKPYYYATKTARVNGKVKMVYRKYLGPAHVVLAKLIGGLPELSIASFSFGRVASVLAMDSELGFSELVDESVGKGSHPKTLSVGKMLLAFIAGRSEHPVSKNGMQGWYNNSYLSLLWGSKSLSCQDYLNNMDCLTDEIMDKVSLDLGKRLVGLGYVPELLFFDGTNFSTEMQPRENDLLRLLPSHGYAKDGKIENNLIGLGLTTTKEGLPLFHEVFAGSETDVSVFKKVVDKMTERILNLGFDPLSLTLVIDKGCNSKEALAHLEGKLHIVGSLKRSALPELLDIPLSEYQPLFENSRKNPITGYRTRATVFNCNYTIVVAFNPASEKKQRLAYEEDKKKFLETVNKIAAKSNTPHRGKPSTTQSLTTNLLEVIPRNRRAIFKFHIGATLEKKFDVKGWIDTIKEQQAYKGFGKSIIFTDMHEWETKKIVQTYIARWHIEDDNKLLKNYLYFQVKPIFHRLDKRIKVHIFLCIMALLFYRYMQLKTKEMELSLEQLLNQLEKIRTAIITIKETKETRHQLEEMNKTQAQLFTLLKLDRYMT